VGSRTVSGSLHLRGGNQTVSLAPGGSVVIGRDPACDFVVDSPLVSRRHLQVSSVGGQWWVQDLRSSNGTFRDGASIAKVMVDAGLVLHLGHPAEGPVLVLTLDGEGATVVEGVVKIGREPGNDLVVDDLMVSRWHAELHPRAEGSGFELVDLNSQNGTYVNGVRVTSAEVMLGDVVNVGSTSLVLTPHGLQRVERPGGVSYAAVGLRVKTPSGKVILDGISFALDESSFLGVVGPSGSGKSTLVNALTGFRPATEGSVFFSGRDLYAEYEHIRQLIGYVPQDDVLHLELTVGQTLEYAAALRFPSAVSKAGRGSASPWSY
jgi:pSer/pThr/pTyr-binding forkhead associated (FHA) protein